MATNLARLNELLANKDIPAFRKSVSPSMNNVKWLRQCFASDSDSELTTLLAMDPKTLLKEARCAQDAQVLNP